MKLKNKISGEIKEFCLFDGNELQGGATLESLTKEWEDCEEPGWLKGYWFIDSCGSIIKEDYYNILGSVRRRIGNCFETEEEAEKAVEKLKALKRLKYKGFRFNGVEVFSEGLLEIDGVLPALKGADNTERLKIIDDLYLIFGGEK